MPRRKREPGPPPGLRPSFLFVHEWWLQVQDDDLKLAGVLINCFAEHDPAMPSDVERTMFDRAEREVLREFTQGDPPETPQQIIYGIWFEPELDWQPALGPVLRDEWLEPLRSPGRGGRGGFTKIIRIEKTDDDRALEALLDPDD